MKTEQWEIKVGFGGQVFVAVVSKPTPDSEWVYVDFHDDADAFLSVSMRTIDTGEGIQFRLVSLLHAYHKGREAGEAIGRRRVRHEIRQALGI